MEHPENIAIGSGVYMRPPHSLSVIGTGRGAGAPAIVIGDGCQFNLGLTIEAVNEVNLERHVLTGSNVFLSDAIRPYPGSSPWAHGHPGESEGNLSVGEGAYIGTNSAVLGPVRIGRGSVVKPNSVVTSDVPDYCAARGNPAVITEVYVPETGKWELAESEEEAARLLERRRRRPLLTIGIPTYNRASNLDNCLQTIFKQIGDSELVEVYVSDNASTDETPAVIERYSQIFRNLKHSRNERNVGADRNILHVTNEASGKFIKLQGDDDFFVDGTILPLLNLLHRNGDCGVVHVNVLNGDGRIATGEGADAYLEATGYAATFITSTILRREDWHRVAEPSKFNDSSLNQFYFQYAVLTECNPKFAIMNCGMFTYAGNEPREYNFGEVFVRNYLAVLRSFEGKGLSDERIRADKAKLFYRYLMPWYRHIRTSYDKEITKGFEEIFVAEFREEPFFDEALAWIRSIG